MALYSDASLGVGGTGFQGTGPESAAAMIKELQGLNVELLTGTTANTKIAVAAIREGDTILKCLNNNAGTITDKTSTMSIVPVKASGTLTLVSAIATDAVTVNGKTYTFQAGAPTTYGQVQIGVSDTASATNLKNAINSYETRVGNEYEVVATSNAGVVTITARAEGTAGNAITISSADSTITASGATLAGGTATGGVMSTDVTNQLILFWYNKQ